MILVTGGTGTVGSEVVKQLVAAGQEVRVLARNPAKAERLAGAEIIAGDMAKPETLGPALHGVDRVFLLASGPEMGQLEANVIDAAKKAGVKHVVKLSVLGADMEPGNAIGRWHRVTEKRLEASGLKWTFVRPGGFMSNDLAWIPTVKSQGVVYNPMGAGKHPSIDPRDIAAVAVKALTEPGHEGKSYGLTGPEPLSTAERVQKLAAKLGREIKCVDVTVEQAQQGMRAQGMPAPVVDAMGEFMNAVRAGYVATVSPDGEKVLGRKLRTYDAWAADHAAAFK